MVLETETRLLLVAACALVDTDGRVLVSQRPPGKAYEGQWEFPGGKVEPGETPEEALVRELAEELGVSVNPDLLQPLTFASHAYPRFHLLMPLFSCVEWEGQLRGCEGQALAWVKPGHLADYPAPDADIPLFAALARRESKRI